MYASSLIRSAIFMLLAFSLLGCGKAELSRSSAKDMIQESSELKALSENVQLNSAAEGKARALDVLDGNGALTPKGAKLFSMFNVAGATLAQPISLPDVDVTGITSVPMAEDMKEVQFSLTFQYPPVIKRFAAKVSGGTALFRRYDDGWRLEKVRISASSEPYPLTAQEMSDEQVETSAIAIEEAKRIAAFAIEEAERIVAVAIEEAERIAAVAIEQANKRIIEQAKRIAAFVYIDKKTGLIWRRCAEGMVISGGTCTGEASEFTYDEALQHAAAEAGRTGLGWRMPEKDELASILDESRSSPAIDPTIFPATPSNWFWSASPVVGSSGYAWGVDFDDGDVDDGYLRSGSGYVRLVRARQ